MRLGNTNVHAARELLCDITRTYDCFRYFVLGRVLSCSVASFATFLTFRAYRLVLDLSLTTDCLQKTAVASWHDNLAERSKAPASGAGPKGRGFKSHSCHTLICECVYFLHFWHNFASDCYAKSARKWILLLF